MRVVKPHDWKILMMVFLAHLPSYTSTVWNGKPLQVSFARALFLKQQGSCLVMEQGECWTPWGPCVRTVVSWPALRQGGQWEATGKKPIFHPCSSQGSATLLQPMGEAETAEDKGILDQEGMCSSASEKIHSFCMWLRQEDKLGDGKQQGKHFYQITNKTVIGDGETISSYSPRASNKSVAEKQDLRFLSSFLVPFCIF